MKLWILGDRLKREKGVLPLYFFADEDRVERVKGSVVSVGNSRGCYVIPFSPSVVDTGYSVLEFLERHPHFKWDEEDLLRYAELEYYAMGYTSPPRRYL